ncbi:MAG TPA: NHL repeat-containing protein [Candidatus Acidoferrales bacterium]|nr:NHL repeat-containing protein [Candidatus Acidoferrales bacterium]
MGKTALRLTITIPHASGTTPTAALVAGTSAGARRPAYISAATQSAVIDITPSGSTTPVSGFPETVNLTPSSAGCTSTVSSTQCVLSLSIAPGSYDVTLSTYDQTGGTGNLLSADQAVPFTVVAGQANSLGMTLGGIPASFEIVPTSSGLTGSVGSGFTLALGASATASVYALDADGNVISGGGAPTISVTSSDPSQVSVVEPSAGAPNTITLNSVAQTNSITLTATATPATGSGGSPVLTTAAVAPPPPRLYVTDTFNNAITVYDQSGDQQTVSGTFANLSNPFGIAYDPADNFLYVASGNAVTAYDLNGNQQTLSGSFAGINDPQGIAYDPTNGFLYVTNVSSTTVTVYDQNGNEQTVSGSFAGMDVPYGIAYDPANGFLYVTNYGNSTVTVYDKNGNPQTLSGTFSGLSSPIGITYDPANGFLYVANSHSNTVTVYDQNGNLQTTSGSFTGLDNPYGIAYDPVNGFLYVTNLNNNTITAYDQNGNKQTLSGSFLNLFYAAGITVVP